MPEERLKGFTRIPNDELVKIAAQLGPTELGYFVMLLYHRNEGTGQCNPSQERLAKMLNVDDQTVRRRTTSLKEAGFIYFDKDQKTAKGEKSRDYTFPTAERAGFWEKRKTTKEGKKKPRITGAEIEELNRRHEAEFLKQPAIVDMDDGWVSNEYDG